MGTDTLRKLLLQHKNQLHGVESILRT